MKQRCAGIGSGPLIAGATCLLLATAGAGADKIMLGRMQIPDVRITDIADGEVSYISAGQSRSTDLDRVSRIEFSRYPGFDDAVEQIDSDPAQAASDLRQILSSVRADHIRRLVGLRLSQALDKAGRAADAIEAWSRAAAGQPSDYFVARLPSTVPDGTDARRAAAQAARRAAGQVRSTAARRALERLSARLDAGAANADRGPQPAGRSQTAPTRGAGSSARRADPAPQPNVDLQAGNDTRTAAVMRSIQTYIDGGQYDRALERIEQVRGQADAELQPAVDYQHAVIDAARGKPIDAAVRWLRVGMLRADHPLAPAALMKAAASLEDAQRPDAALTVWRQAAQASNDPAQRRQIQARIDDLQAG